MNRYTLIVDGNYFLHKTLFISGKIKRKGSLNFIDEPEKDSDLLANKLATDFAYEVRRFSPILDFARIKTFGSQGLNFLFNNFLIVV